MTDAILEWAIFLALSGVAVVMSASILVTMSMYRAGLALMASFFALAGLFILLDADLLAAIQVMMNLGGMLVMVLFMVMQMMDPGGEMMWDMKRKMGLRGPGALSMTMPRHHAQAAEPEATRGTAGDWTCPMHPEVSRPGPGECPKCGMALVPRERPGGETEIGHEDGMSGMSRRQDDQMMVDMAMSTAQLPWALGIGVTSALVLVLLVIRTPWPLSGAAPSRAGVEAVGELLLSRYMIGFEGAAFLILAGMVGAVILGKAGRRIERTRQVAADRRMHACPMHPEVRQPASGQCPICGMDLVPADEPATAGDHEHHQS